MSLTNTFILDLDMKDNSYISEPYVTSNDAIRFVVNIFDDGIPFELTNVSVFSLASTRPDGVVVVKSGTKTGTNQITFDLGSTEILVVGKVYAKVQMYDEVGRVSTLSFIYTVDKDPLGNGYVPSTDEQTLIEEVLGRGVTVIEAAEEATVNANNAAQNAITSVSNIQAAEDIRGTSENTRLSNETSRVTAETNRVSAEGARVTAEGARVSAESTRVTNETTRQNNETNRVTAENTRITDETTRGTNETTRTANETSRVNAESTRVTAETTRAANETSRVTAETSRVNAESTRVTAENTRGTNETSRVTAETSRDNAETDRVTAESSRVTSESGRVTAESERSTAESTRVSNEITRNTNETSRQANETARQTAIAAIVHRGPYNAGTSYVINNSVEHNGSTYRCIQNTTGNLPTNPTYWTLEAQAGADGLGTGDMLKSVYDTTGNNIVDAAESVPWTGVTGKPTTLDGYGITDSASDSELSAHTGDSVIHITGTERTTWNGKQAALGFTPENVAKKGVANGYAGLDANGNMIINGSIPATLIAGRSYVAVQGTSNAGGVDLSANVADADGVVHGVFQVTDKNSTNAVDKRLFNMGVFTNGTTANDRGGEVRIAIKPNGGPLSNRFILKGDGTVLTTNNTLDNGLGNMTIAGLLKVAPTTGSIAANPSMSKLEVVGVEGAGNAAFMTFHRPNNYAAHFGIDTDNQLKFGGFSAGAFAYTVWHSGNDGSGSGLDADKVRNVNIFQQNQGDHAAALGLVEQMRWKNYGNNHTIFDASAGTAPNGTAVSNTNSQNAWQGSYGNLMGWNGSNTFGVRVDSSRTADGIKQYSTAAPGSYLGEGVMWAVYA